MKKLFIILPILTTLTACVGLETQGTPVVIQTKQPTVIIDNRTVAKADPNAPIYVCSTKPFMETYKAENVNRGKAILSVQKQCLANNDDMFCEIKDIECTEYK